MNALPFQIRVATNNARNVLLGPSWEFQISGARTDDDTDFAGMQARIENALKAVEAADPKAMDAASGDGVAFWPSGKLTCR
jgi:hypothetical protein